MSIAQHLHRAWLLTCGMFTKILAVAEKNGEKWTLVLNSSRRKLNYQKMYLDFFLTSHGLVLESVGDGAYSIIFSVWNCQKRILKGSIKVFDITHQNGSGDQCSRKQIRQKLWNHSGHANFMLYCRAVPFPHLDHEDAGISGVKPHDLEFKNTECLSPEYRN